MGKIGSKSSEITQSPTDSMQREIRRTEAEISDTLHSIEAKLAPDRLKRQVKGKLLQGSATAVVRAGYAIKRRPLPSAAIGAGVVWLLKRRSRKRHAALPLAAAGRGPDYSAALVQAMPKELRKNPVKTFKKYLTLGRMALAFVSVASTVLMRGKRAQRALQREPYGDYEEHPAHL
jgi:hypothetical protein